MDDGQLGQYGDRQGQEEAGEEEMDGGGKLISHSHGRSRAGRRSPTGVMVNFITQISYRISERAQMDFCLRTQPLVIYRRRSGKYETYTFFWGVIVIFKKRQKAKQESEAERDDGEVPSF